jgi:hypothetical protein
LVFFSLALYITFTVENGAFAWLYLGYPILLALIVGLITCRELNMVACRHVAITSRGVWLDMSDGPASLLLAQRQVYKFESIDGCYVFSSGFLRPIFQVVIAIKGAPPMGGSHVISGLSNGQAFVDLVTALMEVDSTTSEPAVFVQAVATQGEQDRFPL